MRRTHITALAAAAALSVGAAGCTDEDAWGPKVPEGQPPARLNPDPTDRESTYYGTAQRPYRAMDTKEEEGAPSPDEWVDPEDPDPGATTEEGLMRPEMMAADDRVEFLAEARRELRDLDEQISAFAAIADPRGAAALDEVRRRYEEAARALDRVEDAPDWKPVREVFLEELQEAQVAYQAALDELG